MSVTEVTRRLTIYLASGQVWLADNHEGPCSAGFAACQESLDKLAEATPAGLKAGHRGSGPSQLAVEAQ